MSRLIAHHRISQLLTQRWLVVFSGFLGQLIVGVMVALSYRQPGTPALTLAPLAGRVGVCRVTYVRPFTEAWLLGLQAGDSVRMVGAVTSAQACLATNMAVKAPVSALGQTLVANAATPPVDGLNALIGVALLFSVMGSAILLRAVHRPMARVTYGLFYCTSLLFCLLSIQRMNALWASALSFALVIVIPGFSATFVWMLPSASAPAPGGQAVKSRRPYLRYSLLLAAGGLVAIGAPLLWWWPQARLAVFLVIGMYSVACIGVILWMFGWGLRLAPQREKPLARVVVIGVLCLLLPLIILCLRLLGSERLAEQRPVALLPLPVIALPLAYGYALFRQQFIGMVSLVSRRLMRIVLWLALACAFVFSVMVGLRILAAVVPLTSQALLFLSAGSMLLSLWFFPLAWSRMRDIGDQVLYRDFYQYNRSLRELSTALTHLQGLEQISAFALPHLARLLNATEIALLVRPSPQTPLSYRADENPGNAIPWRVYRHPTAAPDLSTNHLIDIAQLALTHRDRPSSEPLILDGLMLLSLYDGETLTGFLCLGSKHSLEPYSRQDTSFLATLAAQISVLEVNSRYLAQAQADAQQLAALSHRVISAQEEERRRLALELHDEVLQQAMLVVRQLSDASSMTEVAEVAPLARSVVEGLRHTCLELRPPLLDELGLEEALRWLAQQTERRSKMSGVSLRIRVRYDNADQPRLPADAELAFYRVAQEALSNALKHADASEIVVKLRRSQRGAVVLLIADNGRGFRRNQPPKDRLGLVGMQERMLAIGGRFQIRSSPGRGVVARAVYNQPTSDVAEETGPDQRVPVFM